METSLLKVLFSNIPENIFMHGSCTRNMSTWRLIEHGVSHFTHTDDFLAQIFSDEYCEVLNLRNERTGRRGDCELHPQFLNKIFFWLLLLDQINMHCLRCLVLFGANCCFNPRLLLWPLIPLGVGIMVALSGSYLCI